MPEYGGEKFAYTAEGRKKHKQAKLKATVRKKKNKTSKKKR